MVQKARCACCQANNALNTNSGLILDLMAVRREDGNFTLYTLTSQKHSTSYRVTYWWPNFNSMACQVSVPQWFLSYLSNGYQRVVLDGAFSDWLLVTSGVLECSILGPQNTTCLDTFTMGLALPCLACSRRSDSRARGKNSRRKKTRGD